MRTHLCGQLTPDLNASQVELSGWAASRRDHGGVIFIDLRDRSGIAQVVIDPDHPEAFAIADQVRNEFVVRVMGKVRPRPKGTENPDRPSGMVEVFADEIEIINRAKPLPFQFEEDGAGEQVRLEYRYLDLRSQQMQRNMRFRAQLVKSLRDYLSAEDFVDIETPILTRSTPEGARDYLVPSRTYPGEFFALPQSPQLFKQLLMVSGFERYYQIARCFRDEDLRADRQPEFSQLDIEMSFVEEEDIMSMTEDMIRSVFSNLLDVDLPKVFPRLTYAESMRRFGVDRPDMRFPLELIDIADLMQDVEFEVFAGPAKDAAGRVAALRVPQGGTLSRQQIDQYTKYVGQFGAKGLAYIKVNELAKGAEGLQSPILKFLTPNAIDGIIERTGLQDGDIVFFGADKADIVNAALGALRVRIGEDLKLGEREWTPLWVVDFPMFEYDSDSKRYVAMHHPFTSPKKEDVALLESAPEKVHARAYDMVLNGSEIGGGSIRIHDQDVQSAVFKALNLDASEADGKFGFLLDALQLGAPPHGGIAFGLDRLSAMMVGAESIREVIAFPKTQKASCLMTKAPSTVGETQLKELGLRLRARVDQEKPE